MFKSLKVFKRYRYLLKQLVSRDFKVKYKRSILGVAWSVLNPLFTMLILNLVFSNLFNMKATGNIKDYPTYLLTGLVLFNYFSEATNLAMGSIISNFNLITKVYIPKYIFPLSKVLSSALNLFFSLIALYLIMIVEILRHQAVAITWVHLILPYDLVCIIIFAIGMGLFLSALTVFFRDMIYIWGVVLTAWNYLTPIMYPETIVTNSKSGYAKLVVYIFKVNPLYYFIKFARTVVLNNQIPSINLFGECLFCSALMLLIGLIFFRAKQDQFIYYI